MKIHPVSRAVWRGVALAGLLTLPLAAAAQSAPAEGGAKKELAQRVVKGQLPAIEALGQSLAEQPAAQLGQRAGQVLQAVPPDKREALAREMQADIRKYVEETAPQVRERAAKLAPGILGPLLEERFSEDELKQLATWLESPIFRKYQQMLPEAQRSLTEKLVAEARPVVEPKVRALEQSLDKRLRAAVPASGAASSPAQAPAKK
ncbi:DUF2059 domain-containing protein [Aquabacterium sp. J223]|uniref:DUF2059 domain-containing protein n=1 Tax=Aquabacterium sp. J223 TaxID=2898431 RepID=UPI0021AD742E|nr:DUF2059 domain-containing protein [Aquabacterium sp. J223]UUX97525.1 DUF2059 domain-containing protein [Aquabacterium sp. J223]